MINDSMASWQNEETLEEMAATVAHEIKNPVALALANLYMIKSEDNERQFARYCNVIERELYKISGLAADFINACAPHSTYNGEIYDFSGLAPSLTGQQPNMEKADVNELLEDVVEDFVNAGVTRIRFTPDAPTFVLCDARKLSIVFTNLIKNALEATEDDGVIEITASLSEGNAIIAVKDNGTGFPQANLSIAQTCSTKHGGSGLGLRICHNTVVRHGGTITLWNNADRGATVMVTLPHCRS